MELTRFAFLKLSFFLSPARKYFFIISSDSESSILLPFAAAVKVGNFWPAARPKIDGLCKQLEQKRLKKQQWMNEILKSYGGKICKVKTIQASRVVGMWEWVEVIITREALTGDDWQWSITFLPFLFSFHLASPGAKLPLPFHWSAARASEMLFCLPKEEALSACSGKKVTWYTLVYSFSLDLGVKSKKKRRNVRTLKTEKFFLSSLRKKKM